MLFSITKLYANTVDLREVHSLQDPDATLARFGRLAAKHCSERHLDEFASMFFTTHNGHIIALAALSTSLLQPELVRYFLLRPAAPSICEWAREWMQALDLYRELPDFPPSDERSRLCTALAVQLLPPSGR